MTTEGDASSRMEDLSPDLQGAAEGDFGPLAADIAGVLGMLAFSGDQSYRYNLPGRPVFTLVVGLLATPGCCSRYGAGGIRALRSSSFGLVVR